MAKFSERHDGQEEIRLSAWVDKECCGGMGKAVLRRQMSTIKLVCDNCGSVRDEFKIWELKSMTGSEEV